MSDHAAVKVLLERKFATGPLACDNTHTMFWNVLTEAEKDQLAQFVADFARDERLKGIKAGRESVYYHLEGKAEDCKDGCEVHARLTKLKRGEA